MIRYRVSLFTLVSLLLMSVLAACTLRVEGTAGAPATLVRSQGHVSQPAADSRHGHASQPAPDARHGHASQPAAGSTHGGCAVYTGTGCYWMENESGQYCWVPADWAADTYEGCYAMDSCDGGKGQSYGGCYKWADSSHAERARWPEQ